MKYSELLVTTPIEETWALKDSKKLIFLGENCKTYSNKRLRIDINNKTLKDPWSNRVSRKIFFENAEKIYERALEYIHINLKNTVPLSQAGIERRKRYLKEVFKTQKQDDDALINSAIKKGFL